MKKLLILICAVVMVVSCNSERSSDTLTFKTLEGKIAKPATIVDAPYDSISVNYKIAWPVGGDEKVVGVIKKWIVEQLSGSPTVDCDNLDIQDVLNSLVDRLADTEGGFDQTINVVAEEDTPFKSYLTINLDDETSYWMARYSDGKSASLSIRLTDRKIFNSDNAIANPEKMSQLIEKYLYEEFIKDNSFEEWNAWIADYNQNGIPMPTKPIQLTKDGIYVEYGMAEISSAPAGVFYCVVPYDEVTYILSDEAQDFLTTPDEQKIEEQNKASIDSLGMTEELAVELIKKANLHEAGSLSSDFQAAYDKYRSKDAYADGPLLKYWYYPDAGEVYHPEIKIFKMIADSETGKVIVVFDFKEASYPQTDWVSMQGTNRSKYVAMDLIRENEKWVVDNYYEESGMSMGKFIDNLKKGETKGEKGNYNFEDESDID